MPAKVKRKLTFYAWADVKGKPPFDRFAAADCLTKLKAKELVLEDDGKLYAVALAARGGPKAPTNFLLFRLRNYDDRPLLYKPGATPRAVTHSLDEYTSDVTHISIWGDNYAAYDAHGNAPGPVRLASYLADKCDQAVDFIRQRPRGPSWSSRGGGARGRGGSG